MSHDEVVLVDILSFAKLLREHVSKFTREQFDADVVIQGAAMHWLVLMGETARRLSKEAPARWPDLPIHEMKGLRNVAVHTYEEVDTNIIWEVVQERIPELIEMIQGHLGGKVI